MVAKTTFEFRIGRFMNLLTAQTTAKANFFFELPIGRFVNLLTAKTTTRATLLLSCISVVRDLVDLKTNAKAIF